jgi:hypothetical protein
MPAPTDGRKAIRQERKKMRAELRAAQLNNHISIRQKPYYNAKRV